MREFIAFWWEDWPGRIALAFLSALIGFTVWCFVYLAQHPDPLGTTYTYEPTVQCLPVVSGSSITVVCQPSYIAIPHYPSATPGGR